MESKSGVNRLTQPGTQPLVPNPAQPEPTGGAIIAIQGGSQIDAKFLDSFNFTTDKEKVSRLVTEFDKSIGFVEADFLRKCPAVVYCRAKYHISDGSSVDATHKSFLVIRLLAVQGMLLDFWVLKDHAVFQDRGWLVVKQLTPGKYSPVVYNNNWMSRHSDAKGSFNPTAFTREEILSALRMVPSTNRYLQGESGPTMLASSSVRFQRFTYFINTVRGADDVAMKIAGYISAIESMVTASSSELTHQVAERVAFYLESAGEARLLLYKQMKAAYGLRSRVVHGGGFSDKKHQEIRDTSMFLDGICRRIFHKYVINEKDISAKIEQDVDTTFLNLIFT